MLKKRLSTAAFCYPQPGFRGGFLPLTIDTNNCIIFFYRTLTKNIEKQPKNIES